MGHDTSSGLTASLAMATCRNQRRQGAGIADVSRAIEDTLIAQFGPTQYATGILATLHLETGVLSWVNRGHLLPIIIRRERWTTTARCPPSGPMGIRLGLPRLRHYAHVGRGIPLPSRCLLDPCSGSLPAASLLQPCRSVGTGCTELVVQRDRSRVIRHQHQALLDGRAAGSGRPVP
ncbi:SpoIIE family protein phosphatase [Streptomyces sp. NBC_00690]|uniref:SpoIIE family protein phosphatase n=1 Tax=Streptomyces sp. NBC_00690 TaxID=2975808 RepID=UPI002E28C44D|nr:SpoIIE family protein phosphatase [Streptomyces sp. NBC_00690]